MGSPPGEPDRRPGEVQVPVTIARSFAVGKFAVTFDQWDACVADGGCNRYQPPDRGWGRGNRPVINVNWADANAYAEWLSQKTGKTYRLLSEAEHEYVTRHHSGGALPLHRSKPTTTAFLHMPAEQKASFGGRQCRSTASKQTRGVFSTFTATCGIGRQTAGMTANKAILVTEARARPATAWRVLSAAVPGASFHSSSARPPASGTSPSGTTTSVSGWPER
jgi:hypothetical protein